MLNQSATDKNIEFKFFFSEKKVEFSLREDSDANIFIDNFAFNSKDLKYSLKNLSIEDYDKKDFSLNNVNKFDIRLDDLFGADNSGIKIKMTPKIIREGFFFQIVSAKPDESIFNNYFEDFFKQLTGRNIKLESVEAENVNRILYKFFNKMMDYLNHISISSSDYLQEIKKDFSDIKYIGPIRQSADRYYITGNFNDLGYKGNTRLKYWLMNVI